MASNGLIEFQVEKRRAPERSIKRFGTARTAFVGRTLRGPVNRPVRLRTFSEFQHIFGGLWQPSTLGYAIEQFFDNGGREAVVVRVVNGARSATLSLKAGSGVLTLRAVRPGTREFLRASVDYDNVPAAAPDEFNLTVQRVRMHGTAQVEDQEIFPRLSVTPGAERYVTEMLADSELILVSGVVPDVRPDRTLDPASGLATGYVASGADGDDGAPLSDYDIIGSEVDKTGLFALDVGDYVNLLCIPPLSRDHDVGASALLVAARFCKERRALLIVDPPAEWLTADDALRGMRTWNFANENALMYFPRILALDKLRGHFESFAPCGAVAGMLARSDEASPVWGAAKTDDAILRPGFRPSSLVSEDRRMRLAARGVNTIQAVRSAARIGVSPRTLAAGAAASADWQSLAARRLALFIINSVIQGTRWAAFLEVHAEVAERVEGEVTTFFRWLHEAGAFGDRPLEESFFVIADPRSIGSATIDAPGFRLVFGFAATRRGEFHAYRIAHAADKSSVTPVSVNRLNSSQYSPEEMQWVDNLASQLRS